MRIAGTGEIAITSVRNDPLINSIRAVLGFNRDAQLSTLSTTMTVGSADHSFAGGDFLRRNPVEAPHFFSRGLITNGLNTKHKVRGEGPWKSTVAVSSERRVLMTIYTYV